MVASSEKFLKPCIYFFAALEELPWEIIQKSTIVISSNTAPLLSHAADWKLGLFFQRHYLLLTIVACPQPTASPLSTRTIFGTEMPFLPLLPSYSQPAWTPGVNLVLGSYANKSDLFCYLILHGMAILCFHSLALHTPY